MQAHHKRSTAADDEAAEWLVRLSTSHIALDTLDQFYAWRDRPGNAEAYQRVEATWDAGKVLSGDADLEAALASARTRGPRSRLPRTTVGLTFALAAAAVLAFGFWAWQGRGLHETGVGEFETVTLADGSVVRLDTASRLRVRYSGGERRIELEAGQALFEVAHDRSRPFVVVTADAAVTAVGTVFEVRRTGATTQVVLVSGVVDVARPTYRNSGQRLAPGQEAVVKAGVASVRNVDAAAATSWTRGKLTFEDTPLTVAVSEVNRYLDKPIRLEAPERGATAINGVFDTGDRSAFVSAAAQLLDLEAVTQGDGSVQLTSRSHAQRN